MKMIKSREYQEGYKAGIGLDAEAPWGSHDRVKMISYFKGKRDGAADKIIELQEEMMVDLIKIKIRDQ